MTKLLYAWALLAITGTSAVPALARPNEVAVRYDDLDLASAAGQAAFDNRLEAAVRQICGNRLSPSLAERTANRSCREATRTNVRAERDLLVAQAEARGGRVVASSRLAVR